MGLWDRIVRLLRSNVNDVIDKAEDPEKILNQIVTELNENLVTVRSQVATAIALEKQLYQKYQQAQNDADKWQQKAELAVDKGEDELAKEALKRKNTSQSTADDLKQQWEQQKGSITTLKASLAKMESKIAETQTKKSLLVARHRRAEAEKKIQSALSTAAGSSSLAAFERMEQKVLEGETKAAALTELNSDSLDERFAALGGGDADADLIALKESRQAKLLSAGDASN
ncbi:MAG: PspA/IM30 family protein [Candidatus Sericytochromatia bacterium]|nr:PspA/IM30 family protein [Candidatus Sericytochromatia bacterium]